MALFIPDDTPKPYHVMSITGAGGSGKTHLAAQAPGMCGLQSSDGRYDGVIQKFGASKFIIGEYFTQIDLSADELFKEGNKELAATLASGQATRITNELWNPFTKDYKQIMENPDVRSCIWDQADEFNEYLRLANFGKLEKNPQMASGPVNMEYKGLIREAHRRKKNLILINQMKQRYKSVTDDNGREKSIACTDAAGNAVMERRANQSADYLIHSFLRCVKTPGPTFTVEIVQAKLNPFMDGSVVEVTDWPSLMALLAPDVPAEAWV